MIPVTPKPEPAIFDKKVRQPGLAFLKSRTPGQKLKTCWLACLDDLWTLHGGICAYMCTYIHRATGGSTLEHMVPKSPHVSLAYEWSNYRLACARLNSRKRDYEDVLDPFEVEDGWFGIAFPACVVLPGKKLPATRRVEFDRTVRRLKLNDPHCLVERTQYFDNYRLGDITFRFLERNAPFIARELDRQKLRRRGD